MTREKSHMWSLTCFLDFEIYCLCILPVLVTYYFVTTTSHYFLWVCSWQDSAGPSAIADVTHEAAFIWKLELEHTGWSRPPRSFAMRLLTMKWLSPSFFTARQMDSKRKHFKRTSLIVHVLINSLFHHSCCWSIGQSKSHDQIQSHCGRDHTWACTGLLHLPSFITFPWLMFWWC